MQVLLRVLDQYSRDWQFQPAFSKTKVLYFGKSVPEPLYLPSMHGIPGVDLGPGSQPGQVSQATEYPHLGVAIADDATPTKHVESVVIPGLNRARGRLRSYYVGGGGPRAAL